MKEIIVKFTFDGEWSDYDDITTDLQMIDALRDLADGVTWEIYNPDENLSQHKEIVWNYLPNFPDTNREVLIAIKYEQPIMGYYKDGKWKGSLNTREWMKDGYCPDPYLSEMDDFIYAWAEIPEMPIIKENQSVTK